MEPSRLNLGAEEPGDSEETNFQSLARLIYRYFEVTGVIIWSVEQAGYRVKGQAGQMPAYNDLCRDLAERISAESPLFIVPDTALDNRLANLSWLGEPVAWRFLAVKGLLNHGVVAGGLALLCHSPEIFGQARTAALKDFARLAEILLEKPKAEEETKRTLAKEAELNELRTQVITLVSHEFRTPLSAILSTSELLQHYEWVPEKKLELFRRIHVSVKHMTQMLDDILLIGKAEAGKLEFAPERLDLAALCRTLVDEVQAEIVQEGRLEFSFAGGEPVVEADPKLIRQILVNLLSNAVKYSGDDSVVFVSLEIDRAQQLATIKVRDEGMGIPLEDQVHLFEVFHRASNVGGIGGTGLGLAIARRSAEKHGGTIAVESQLDKGATFTVKLPVKT